MAIPTESREFQKLSKAEMNRLGLPEGWKIFSPFPFGGIDQKSSRYGMPDQKFFWCENIIKTGNGKLRAVPDVGQAIYTAPAGKSILSQGGMYFYNIGITDYMIVFLTDGTAYQINLSNFTVKTVSGVANTFFRAGGNSPDTGPWGSQYLIITNNNTVNDYWVWDGSVLYTSGTIAPIVTLTGSGSGYTSLPAVTVFGGSGSGATAVARIANGVVTGVIFTNAGTGYQSGDIVQLQFAGGGASSGALLRAVITANAVSSVTVINPGAGFTTVPTLSFQGGGGSGATATATVTAGVISSVTVGSGGSNYSSPPAVIVQPGTNSAATAMATVMPFGVSGVNIETFDQRVWLAHPFETSALPLGGVINVSAPGSFVDFNVSDGAVVFTNTDRFLKKEYTNLIQSNGYLYPIGDSSVNVISNVQTSGNPPLTTFNYQNTDPTIGTPFHNTVQPFGRAVMLLNENGVYALYGGSVNRVSSDIDDIFDTAIFPPAAGALSPSASVAYIHDVLYYIVLLTITDPFTNKPRNVMLLWDEKEWYVASQTMNLTYIVSQTVASAISTYGTDGTVIKKLFTVPSPTLQKVLTTKLYGAQAFYISKMGFNVMLQGQGLNASDAIMSLVLNTENGNVPLPYTADLTTPMVFTGPVEDAYGAFMGLTIASTSADFWINEIALGYGDVVGPFGAGALNAPVGT